MQRSLGATIVLAVVVGTGTSVPAERGKGKQPRQKTASVAAAQPTLLGQYAEWGAYSATPEGGKICFVLAKPKSSATVPANRKRDQAYIFISSRPADKVRNEISVILGYPIQQNSDATAEINSVRYSMYTEKDGAWIRNLADEARLIEAMRKGAELTVKGTSTRYATTTDQYSLKGLTQAMDRVDQECKE